jgi:hypothetical protein
MSPSGATTTTPVYRHRTFVAALAIFLLTESVFLGLVGYQNCGALEPVTGVPQCFHELPEAFDSALKLWFHFGLFPADRIVPGASFGWIPGVPWWVVDWAPAVLMAAIDALVWAMVTMGLVTMTSQILKT